MPRDARAVITSATHPNLNAPPDTRQHVAAGRRFPYRTPPFAAITESTMNRKSSALILSAALALAGAGFAAAPAAQAVPQVSVGVGVGIGVAPPPPRFERAPPPRRGYAWAPGYWSWSPRLHRHVWVGGRWMRVHPGYHYMPARWQQGPRGHWHFSAGYWAR